LPLTYWRDWSADDDHHDWSYRWDGHTATGSSTTLATSEYVGTPWQMWTSATTSTGGWHYLYYTASPIYTERPLVRMGAAGEAAVVLAPPEVEVSAAVEDLRAARLARALARSESQVVAESRAVDLLVRMLPPEQVEVYRREGHFDIVGSHGTRYRIRPGTVGNVAWLDAEGRQGGLLCAHPASSHGLPTPDVHLAQMLVLQTDEREFLRIANLHAGVMPPLVA